MNYPSLRGKTALITGPTSGIGEVTARTLAGLGAGLILLGRNPAKLEALRLSIQEQTPGAQASVFSADLSSMAQVREAAAQIRESEGPIDLLINNAGAVMGSRREVSADGLEMTFATNHQGHFLLTALLFERLAADARIINVSSAAHAWGSIDFDNLQLAQGYEPWRAYCNAKLCNVLFTRELDRRLRARGLAMTANALHPGAVRTGFGANSGPGIAKLLFSFFALFFISAEEGAKTSLHLACAPELAGQSGKYFAKSQEAKPNPRWLKKEVEQKLWEASEALADVRFL
jgi:NAD(P)-dependent dehydrogenase (short-subunit alcohol dehydrogenase family)